MAALPLPMGSLAYGKKVDAITKTVAPLQQGRMPRNKRLR